jgi:hypothetical protein
MVQDTFKRWVVKEETKKLSLNMSRTLKRVLNECDRPKRSFICCL